MIYLLPEHVSLILLSSKASSTRLTKAQNEIGKLIHCLQDPILFWY